MLKIDELVGLAGRSKVRKKWGISDNEVKTQKKWEMSPAQIVFIRRIQRETVEKDPEALR